MSACNQVGFHKVVLLDDLLRQGSTPARRFIYNLIREPITQALNCEFPDTRTFPAHRGLSEGFDAEEFRTLTRAKHWTEIYRRLPNVAADYLIHYLPKKSLVIGYEMPPWLITLLDVNDIPRVNVRISPLRFARDLYVAVNSNLASFRSNADELAVTDNELRIEAGLMQASISHNAVMPPPGADFSGGVLFVGQTGCDTSLIGDDGGLLNVTKFAEDIRAYVNGRPLAYKPHPYDKSFAKKECKALQKITKKRLSVVKYDIYTLLCSSSPFDILTLSSGVAQEAVYFNRASKILHRSVCDLKNKGDDIGSGFKQFRFMDFINPKFWALIAEANIDVSAYDYPVAMPDSLMRRLHNSWWGYSNYILDNDNFWRHAVTRGMRNALLQFFRGGA